LTFPDVPEALTGDKDLDEAIELAADALTTAINFYFEDRRPVPVTSPLKRGQVAVDLPDSVSAMAPAAVAKVAQRFCGHAVRRAGEARAKSAVRGLQRRLPFPPHSVAERSSARSEARRRRRQGWMPERRDKPSGAGSMRSTTAGWPRRRRHARSPQLGRRQ
jgi:antitoxin HicB